MTRLDRLRHLSAFLRTVPAEKFDFSTWVQPCGSPGCAVGWACSLPEFQAEGLSMATGCPRTPVYRGLSSFEAVALFFNVSWSDARSLFAPGLSSAGRSGLSFSATPAQVADHIDAYLEAR